MRSARASAGPATPWATPSALPLPAPRVRLEAGDAEDLAIRGDRAFTGAGGSASSCRLRLDKGRVAVGEAATLKVRLSGPGGSGRHRSHHRRPSRRPGLRPTTRTGAAAGPERGARSSGLRPRANAPVRSPFRRLSLETFDPTERSSRSGPRPPLPVGRGWRGSPGTPGTAAPGARGGPKTTFRRLRRPPRSRLASAAGGTSLDLSRRTVTLPLGS